MRAPLKTALASWAPSINIIIIIIIIIIIYKTLHETGTYSKAFSFCFVLLKKLQQLCLLIRHLKTWQIAQISKLTAELTYSK